MKYKFVIVVVVALYFTSGKCFSQSFDSTHIYAIYMNTLYNVTLDKDLIKNETEPVVIIDKEKIKMLYSSIIDALGQRQKKKIKSNYIDIRLYFEFFQNGKVVREMGFTPQNIMFIDHSLYKYEKQELKYLDRYVSGLTEILGIK